MVELSGKMLLRGHFLTVRKERLAQTLQLLYMKIGKTLRLARYIRGNHLVIKV
jgi:hypothetical protein